jgi:hypothetical protein
MNEEQFPCRQLYCREYPIARFLVHAACVDVEDVTLSFYVFNALLPGYGGVAVNDNIVAHEDELVLLRGTDLFDHFPELVKASVNVSYGEAVVHNGEISEEGNLFELKKYSPQRTRRVTRRPRRKKGVRGEE